jgi:hypothetical protein
MAEVCTAPCYFIERVIREREPTEMPVDWEPSADYKKALLVNMDSNAYAAMRKLRKALREVRERLTHDTPVKVVAIGAMKAVGLTYAEIGEILNLSARRVSAMIKEFMDK